MEYILLGLIITFGVVCFLLGYNSGCHKTINYLNKKLMEN
jgi:uncharacterized protein YneF (UPF0154 family)